jgi:hypothetical protein
MWKRGIFAAGILSFWICDAALAKKEEQITTPPPLAKTGMVTAYLHKPQEVVLQVRGRIFEPLTFLIRKPPRRGRLGEVRRTSMNTATVTYFPDPAAGPLDDFFTFAAKSSDSPVSAPATVWVRVLEASPVLEHPAELDFGAVFLGDSVERKVVLRNSGGGRASGRIDPNSPWTVRGSSAFSVPAGAETSFTLVFCPPDERSFSDRLRLGPEQGDSIELHGQGIAPFSWPRGGWVFSPEQRANGTAEFAVTNETPEEKVLAVEWPGFIKADREIRIPAGATASIKAGVVGTLKKAFQGSANVRSGNFTAQIPLTIYPKSAKLAIVPESGLDLGEGKNREEIKGSFVLKNIGESDARLNVSAPDDIQIFPSPAGLVLAAGGEQSFEIRLSGFKPGPRQGQIVFGAPCSDAVHLDYKASLRDGATASLPVENFLNLPEKPELTSLPPTGKVPPVKVAWLVSSTPHEVEITWDVTSPETSRYVIQQRKISSPEDRQVVVEWIDWPEVEISITEGQASGRWQSLPENSRWTIRIIGFDADGTPGPPSDVFQIATSVSPRLEVPHWVWLVLLSTLWIALVRRSVMRRRVMLAREDERIALLERRR